jgi:hypothetical protein
VDYPLDINEYFIQIPHSVECQRYLSMLGKIEITVDCTLLPPIHNRTSFLICHHVALVRASYYTELSIVSPFIVTFGNELRCFSFEKFTQKFTQISLNHIPKHD